MLAHPLLLLTAFLPATALAQGGSHSAAEQATSFVQIFGTVCFELNWEEEKEWIDLDLLGFERMDGAEPWRYYLRGKLFALFYLSRTDSPAQRPACKLQTRWMSAGLVRNAMLNWEPAGQPVADQIEDGARLTLWRVKYAGRTGSVLMEEASDNNGTVVSLSLLGE